MNETKSLPSRNLQPIKVVVLVYTNDAAAAADNDDDGDFICNLDFIKNFLMHLTLTFKH